MSQDSIQNSPIVKKSSRGTTASPVRSSNPALQTEQNTKNDFVLDGTRALLKVAPYDSKADPYLRFYFQNPRVKMNMYKAGVVNMENAVIFQIDEKGNPSNPPSRGNKFYKGPYESRIKNGLYLQSPFSTINTSTSGKSITDIRFKTYGNLSAKSVKSQTPHQVNDLRKPQIVQSKSVEKFRPDPAIEVSIEQNITHELTGEEMKQFLAKQQKRLAQRKLPKLIQPSFNKSGPDV